ncbi:MAG: polysaccharide biosynthesis protein [Clostridia bacterium]|jgi:UDP-N-acetylglucosamine:LPS N-acetylglucosamine transferase|nr:polysaccharide biosynthesis protein [Clostridia bacterium]
MKKVIFAASSGGHLTELLKVQELFKDYDYLLVTEMTDVTRDLKDKYNIKYVDYGPNKNKIKYWWTIIKNLAKAIGIVAKFRPDTVVSTGAQVGGFFCYIGKFFGAKVVYIETMAKIKELSGTGHNVYKIADKFYVQWKSLEEKYEKAEYIGRLI